MPVKRYSVEQIDAKLREAEKLQGEEMTIRRPARSSEFSTRRSTAGA